MKNYISLLIVLFAFFQISLSQTITKQVSKNTVFIEEEFFYTVTISNIRDLSDLVTVTDNLGPNLDFVRVEYSQEIIFLENWGFCSNVSDVYDPLSRDLTVTFDNCSGSAVGFNSFSFKIFVKFNNNACGNLKHDNQAVLNLSNGRQIRSDNELVNINDQNPFTLQKTFRRYDAANQEVIYDVRLSSVSNNFDILNSAIPSMFKDSFTVPNCFTLNGSASAVDVVLINDTATMTGNSVSPQVNMSPLTTDISWPLNLAQTNISSVLYQVKIKVDDCNCVNANAQLFQLKNSVGFSGYDVCGNRFILDAESIIDNVGCTTNSGSGGTSTGSPSIPEKIKDSICFTKSLKLDNNDLNLSMKGCTGKYTIRIDNCTSRLNYSEFKLKDILPSELSYQQPIITGSARHTLNGNTLTVSETGPILPNDSVEIEIPFEVTTPLANQLITNCADLEVLGDDSITKFTLNRTSCATPLKTVPNEVALNTTKSVCSKPGNQCGASGDYLPGDTVEYAMHFYNYGTVEGKGVLFEDNLPQHLSIANFQNDVTVYKLKSGEQQSGCDVADYDDITTEVRIGYDRRQRLLKIDFKGERLDEFTCKGVTNYVVKMKAEISRTAPSGVYENVFKIDYTDASTGIANSQLSNSVPITVNADNLVIANKTAEQTDEDCYKQTKTFTYSMLVANMGAFPVSVDITDNMPIPSGTRLLNYGNFKYCTSTGLTSTACVPSWPFTITTTSTSGFSRNGLKLKPCEVIRITYEATFDVSRIGKGKSIQVCNNADFRAYYPNGKNKKNASILMVSKPGMIQQYFDAETSQTRLDAIAMIKAVKSNPEVTKNTNPKRYKNYKPNRDHDYGKSSVNECIELTNCLPAKESVCLTDGTSNFDFSITGMNRNGEISTVLNNTSGKKIIRINYAITDIFPTNVCDPETFYFRNRRYYRGCFGGCTRNVFGKFYNVSPPPNAGNFTIYEPQITGRYVQTNVVEYTGSPATLTQDNRIFKFPKSVNCSGTYDFTITATVFFEDCSVCYVSDSYKYNGRFRLNYNPRRRIPNFSTTRN